MIVKQKTPIVETINQTTILVIAFDVHSCGLLTERLFKYAGKEQTSTVDFTFNLPFSHNIQLG